MNNNNDENKNYPLDLIRKHKVYKHTCTVNGKTYVGITSQKVENRWRNGDGYPNNKYFTNAIKKYGWNNFTHEILHFGLTQEEADEREIELIRGYKSQKLSYNITDGGEGRLGVTLSEETKSLISKNHCDVSGENNPMYGVRLTGSKNHMYGRTGKNNPNSKRVLQMDLKGNPIKEWDCLMDVERELKIFSTSIAKCCKNKANKAGGYKWKYI